MSHIRTNHQCAFAEVVTKCPLRHARLTSAVLFALAVAGPACAATYVVTDETSLRDSLRAVDVGGTATDVDNTIQFANDIAITTNLWAINLPTGAVLVIDGAGHALDGGNVTRGLFAYAGTARIQDLTIRNVVATGGQGDGGGGAGAGLGGGLFVNSGTNLVLSSVTFENTQATGGGAVLGNRGGGGGLGGPGGTQGAGQPGGGGGIGVLAGGGHYGAQNGGQGIVSGTGSGGDGYDGATIAGIGGALGGGGGAGLGAGGGGVNGSPGTADFNGGAGGFGGGGGAGSAAGGNGGFGGGGGGDGGGNGGNGGFGGGGGGGGNSQGAALGSGGFGGASAVGGGSPGDTGGGGAGFGGAMFVMSGASVSIEGSTGISNSLVAAGTTAAGNNGVAAGSGLFLHDSGALTFAPGSGDIQTIAADITDMAGFAAATDYAPPVGCSGDCNPVGQAWTLSKQGLGIVVLSGTNTYAGGTSVSNGVLQIGGDTPGGSVSGAVNVSGGTLAGSGQINGTINLGGAGDVSPGTQAGDVAGVLTAVNLSWGSGGEFDMQLGDNAAHSDELQLGGTMTQNGSGTFLVNFFDGPGLPQPGTTYTLIGFGSQTGFSAGDFSYRYNGVLVGFGGSFALDASTLKFKVMTGTLPIPPTLAKSFAPNAIPDTQTTQLTITLGNNNSAVMALNSPLVDNLPSGLQVALQPGAATTCPNGLVTANAGSTSVTLEAGSRVPLNGTCTVTVSIAAHGVGQLINVMPAGALQTTLGSNAVPASATLNVSADRIFTDGFDGTP